MDVHASPEKESGHFGRHLESGSDRCAFTITVIGFGTRVVAADPGSIVLYDTTLFVRA